MTKENINITNILVDRKLTTLRDKILEFAKVANDCNIVMTNHQSIEIGEIKGELNNGGLVKDKVLHRKYDALIEEYDQFSDKLLSCDCKQK